MLKKRINYYPFGLQHKGYNTQIIGQEHQYKYNGTELTEELGLNWYEMPLRSYDPAIARWNRIDPVVHHGLSPYNAFDNNPIFYADPSGGDSYGRGESIVQYGDDIIASGGYMNYNSNGIRGNIYNYFHGTGENKFGIYGSANRFNDNNGGIVLDASHIKNGSLFWINNGLNNGLGSLETFNNQEAMINLETVFVTEGDERSYALARNNIANQISGTCCGNQLTTINSQQWDNSAMAWALGTSGVLLADDATGIGVIDDVLIPFVMIGGVAVYLYDNAELMAKQAKEIDRIMQKTLGPTGFTYALTVNQSGVYLDVRGNPIQLNAGDVWKYGETSKGFSRYSQSTLDGMVPGGVSMLPLFFGNQVEIKVQEKIMIYGHVLMNGSLPPGNKIFR